MSNNPIICNLLSSENKRQRKSIIKQTKNNFVRQVKAKNNFFRSEKKEKNVDRKSILMKMKNQRIAKPIKQIHEKPFQ